MNLQQILNNFDDLTKNARITLENKNHDYSSRTNALANLKACELLDVPPYKGVLIRLLDKIVRVSNVLDKGKMKVDESIDEVCIDAINYFVLLYSIVKEPKETNKKSTPTNRYYFSISPPIIFF